MKRPAEVPRTTGRDNRRQTNHGTAGLGGNVYRRPPQGGEQRAQGGTTRPEARVQPHQNLGRNPPVMVEAVGTQMGRVAGGRDFGRVTGGSLGGELPGEGRLEVRPEATDMGPLEAVVSEAHPA